MNRFLKIISFFIITLNCEVDASHGGRHVLFISSYNPSFPTFNQQVDGIRSVFDKESMILDMEFMDTKRFPGEENVRYFHKLLSCKFLKFSGYDAVMAADDAALLYALSQVNGLFKNLPVFFCGVNDIDLAGRIEKNTRVRGVVEAVSMRETLQLIRDIFPERKKIAVIINRPLSFYEMHKIPVIASAAFISALIYIIFILVYHSRRLRKMVTERTGELTESEAKWKFYLDVSGQIIWDWNLNTNKIFTSRKWNETLWLNNEETFDALTERISEIHPEDVKNVVEVMIAHLKGVIPVYECLHRVMVKDGAYRWVLSRGKVVERLADGKPLRVIGTATDVTVLKQIEGDIIRSRKMLQLVLDTIPVGVFWKDMDLRYIGCNNSFTLLLGVESPENFIGKKDIDFVSRDLAAIYNKTDNEVISSGLSKLSYEEQMPMPDGTMKTIRKSKVPLTGNSGEIIGILGIYEDITEQKNMRDEVLRIKKLESVGILASGIAHDFNNLLMAISGSLSVLKFAEEHNEKSLRWLGEAERSCLTATELTTRLITFSQSGSPVLQPENISDIINESIESVKYDDLFRVNYFNGSTAASIMIDARQIRQVIINLIENAREAMKEGGTVDIVSSETILDDKNTCELPSGKYLVISVKDTGPGIPESIIDKIFDPYFSTKEMGVQKGQGLGLAICHSIIIQHKGKITVNSTPGIGTSFTIYIPFSR